MGEPRNSLMPSRGQLVRLTRSLRELTRNRFFSCRARSSITKRSRGDSPDEALAAGAVFGLGAAAGAVSAVSSDYRGPHQAPLLSISEVGEIGRV